MFGRVDTGGNLQGASDGGRARAKRALFMTACSWVAGVAACASPTGSDVGSYQSDLTATSASAYQLSPSTTQQINSSAAAGQITNSATAASTAIVPAVQTIDPSAISTVSLTEECRSARISAKRAALAASALWNLGATRAEIEAVPGLLASVSQEICQTGIYGEASHRFGQLVLDVEHRFAVQLPEDVQPNGLFEHLYIFETERLNRECMMEPDGEVIDALQGIQDLGVLSDTQFDALEDTLAFGRCGPGMGRGSGGSRLDFLSCMHEGLAEKLDRELVDDCDSINGTPKKPAPAPSPPPKSGTTPSQNCTGPNCRNTNTTDRSSRSSSRTTTRGGQGGNGQGGNGGNGGNGQGGNGGNGGNATVTVQCPACSPGGGGGGAGGGSGSMSGLAPEVVRSGAAVTVAVIQEVGGIIREGLRAVADVGSATVTAAGNVLSSAVQATENVANRLIDKLPDLSDVFQCPAIMTENGPAMLARRDAPDGSGGARDHMSLFSVHDLVRECKCSTGNAPTPGTLCGDVGLSIDSDRAQCMRDPFGTGGTRFGTRGRIVDPELCREIFAGDNPTLVSSNVLCLSKQCADGATLDENCDCVTPGGSGGGSGSNACETVNCGEGHSCQCDGPDCYCQPADQVFCEGPMAVFNPACSDGGPFPGVPTPGI